MEILCKQETLRCTNAVGKSVCTESDEWSGKARDGGLCQLGPGVLYRWDERCCTSDAVTRVSRYMARRGGGQQAQQCSGVPTTGTGELQVVLQGGCFQGDGCARRWDLGFLVEERKRDRRCWLGCMPAASGERSFRSIPAAQIRSAEPVHTQKRGGLDISKYKAGLENGKKMH